MRCERLCAQLITAPEKTVRTDSWKGYPKRGKTHSAGERRMAMNERRLKRAGWAGLRETSARGESPLQSSCAPSPTPRKNRTCRSSAHIGSIGVAGIEREGVPGATSAAGGKRGADPAVAAQVGNRRAGNARSAGRERTANARRKRHVLIWREGHHGYDGKGTFCGTAESRDDLRGN